MIHRREFLSSSLGLGVAANLSTSDLPIVRSRTRRVRIPKVFANLDDLFRKYPDCPQMRQAARTYRRAWTRNRFGVAGQTLTGCFFWVPEPGTEGAVQWELHEFFDCWKSGSEYGRVWRHIQDTVRIRWRRSIKHLSYWALPRGRVRRVPGRSPVYRILHGGDYPAAGPGLENVRTVFNLSPTASERVCESERMMPGQLDGWFKTVGIGLSDPAGMSV